MLPKFFFLLIYILFIISLFLNQISCLPILINPSPEIPLSNDSTPSKRDSTCSQSRDCLSCSLDPSCTWTGSSCKSIEQNQSLNTSSFLQARSPAVKCGIVESCEQQAIPNNLTGVIELSKENILKHQSCFWRIKPAKMLDKSHFELRILMDGLDVNDLDDSVNLYIQDYIYNTTTSQVQYSLHKIDINKNLTITHAYTTELLVFLQIDPTVKNGVENFRLEYLIKPVSKPLDNLAFIFKILYLFVFLFCVTSGSLAAFQNLKRYYKRRRLLTELHSLEERPAVENNRDHFKLEVKENDKKINRIIYDEQAGVRFEQSECVICLEEYHKDESLVEFDCKHVFHIKCFEKWVDCQTNTEIKCPICNRIFE